MLDDGAPLDASAEAFLQPLELLRRVVLRARRLLAPAAWRWGEGEEAERRWPCSGGEKGEERKETREGESERGRREKGEREGERERGEREERGRRERAHSGSRCCARPRKYAAGYVVLNLWLNFAVITSQSQKAGSCARHRRVASRSQFACGGMRERVGMVGRAYACASFREPAFALRCVPRERRAPPATCRPGGAQTATAAFAPHHMVSQGAWKRAAFACRVRWWKQGGWAGRSRAHLAHADCLVGVVGELFLRPERAGALQTSGESVCPGAMNDVACEREIGGKGI